MISSRHSQRRADLLRLGAEFVRAATHLPGVQSISLLGSICTDRQHPKDIDFLVVIGEDVDLARLAACGRRLKGRAQGLSSGADIFLVNPQHQYIGRICHYRECWPRPPVTIWPELEKRHPLPTDVEDFLNQVATAVR